jgi:GTP cyclohydrolase IB
VKPIPDLQSQSDDRLIDIDKVGVKGVRYPIIVEDRTDGEQKTVADISLFVELHHAKRGTHMSRFLEVLNHYHTDTIISNLEKLLSELRQVLKADAAYIDMSFPYFIKKHAPVSKISSLMDYRCFFQAELKDGFDLTIGAQVPVTTLCPCSKEISVAGAHNQRSIITLKVRYKQFIWLEELISIAEEEASCPVYPLLKRRDEKYVTEKAYANPKFVEDIIRDITARLEADGRITYFSVEVDSSESIHNHNAYAMITRDKMEENKV